jgi:hypothetical protein
LAEAFLGLLGTAGNRGLFVLGDYGTGKSHSVTLLRDLALSEGYATCWLTADGYECALNHPQRFVSSVLGTLETPHGDSGYSALIARLLATPTLQDSVVMRVLGDLNGRSNLELAVRAVLLDLATAADGMEGAEETHLQADALARLLTGETLTGLGNLESYRHMAYRLLRLAEHLVRLPGCRGLVIVVDEVESVFTKLWNYRSRFGAYRTLSALCVGMETANIKVAMAVTPDTFAAMASELSANSAFLGYPPFEPLERYSEAIEASTIPVLRCQPLTTAQLDQLAWRIRALYGETYPGISLGSGKDWMDTVKSILHRKPPVRVAIRDCIDALDRIRLVSDRGL